MQRAASIVQLVLSRLRLISGLSCSQVCKFRKAEPQVAAANRAITCARAHPRPLVLAHLLACDSDTFTATSPPRLFLLETTRAIPIHLVRPSTPSSYLALTVDAVTSHARHHLTLIVCVPSGVATTLPRRARAQRCSCVIHPFSLYASFDAAAFASIFQPVSPTAPPKIGTDRVPVSTRFILSSWFEGTDSCDSDPCDPGPPSPPGSVVHIARDP